MAKINLKMLNPFKLLKGKKNDNVIRFKPKYAIETEPETSLYATRRYQTWTGPEIAIIIDKISTVIKKKKKTINLTELHKFMPNRSISGIRCKVLWILNYLGYTDIGTYTLKK